MKVNVNGIVYANVEVNPIDVLKKLRIIPEGDWIIERNGKFIHMEDVAAGQHSINREVGEVSKEKHELYQAQQLLLKFLEGQQNFKPKK